MDLNKLFDDDGIQVPNPKYNKKTAKTESPTKTVMANQSNTSNIYSDALHNMPKVGQVIIGDDAAKKAKEFEDYDMTLTYYNYQNAEKQLAEAQSAFAKFGNAALQTVGSEIVLGTLLGISDLVDFFANIGNENNDYTNPVSESLEKAQESFREWAPIHVDPDKNIANGGLTDAGWWASNLPSVASTLTLLVPGEGVAKGVSLLGKVTKIGEGLGYTRRALTGMRNIEKLDKAAQAAKLEKMGSVRRFINGRGKDMFNTGFENLVNAGTMRVVENYQESKDTYKQMYEQASEKFNNMDDKEWNKYVQTHAEELGEVANSGSRDDVARAIAKKAADKTFQIDMSNLVFDFMELTALKDMGKLSRNVRQSASVRKAERIAKKQAKVDLGLEAEDAAEKASESIKKKIGNWLSDHKNVATPLFAELSEGVEEAVNYVAQQEGINYGKILLEDETANNNGFGNRLYSYLKAPELWESAFWGVAGGILFQNVAGNIRLMSDKLTAKATNKNKDEKKGEKSTSWSEFWDTPTTKRQIEEINSRAEAAKEARRKLDMIDNDQNPYDNLEDNNTPRSITTNTERESLKERVINDYVTDLTVKAVDAGNYDALIEYLEDENVTAALQQKGLIDGNGVAAGGKSIVDQVKQVADRYQDNLFLINTISGSMKGGVPMEYQQIMARENTYNHIKIATIDKQIAQYETAENSHKDLYKNSLKSAGFGDGVGYKTAIFLVEASQRLGELKAQRNAIINDPDIKDSLQSQDMIRFIDRQIDAINEQLTQGEDKVLNASRLVWAHKEATRFVHNAETGQTSVNSTNAKYITVADLFNNAVTSRKKEDIKALQHELGIDFDITDDNIIMMFGDGTSNGAYTILNEDLKRLFPDQEEINHKKLKEDRDKVAKGIKEAAPALYEDYINLSALQFAKIYNQALLNTNITNISRRKQELDNALNEARVKAKNKSYEVLDRLEEKYGIVPVLDYINGNKNAIEGLNNYDKRDLEDALAILDLQKEANSSLIDEIMDRLINNKARRAKNKANESQNSFASSEAAEEPQTNQPNNISQQAQQAQNQANSGQNQGVAQSTATEKGKGKMSLSVDIDGNLNTDLIAENDHTLGVTYREDADGNIILEFDKSTELDKFPAVIQNKLFDFINNTSASSSDQNFKVTKNPVIKKEGNNYTVIEKGTIEVTDKNSDTYNITGPLEYTTETKNDITTYTIVGYPTDQKSRTSGKTRYKSLTISKELIDDKFKDSLDNHYNDIKELRVKKIRVKDGTISADCIIVYNDGSTIEATVNLKENPILSTGGQEQTGSKPGEEGKVNQEEENRKELAADFRSQIQNAAKALRKDPNFAGKSDVEILKAAVESVKSSPSYNDSQEPALLDTLNAFVHALSRKGINLDVADLIHHSIITEEVKTDNESDYVKAVDKLVEKYVKSKNLPVIEYNNSKKTYINLASLLRAINSEYKDNRVASLIYEQLVNYITSDLGKEKYVVTDLDPKSPDFINEITKSLQERIAESKTSEDVHRVNIYDYIDTNDKNDKVRKVLGSLRKGSKLTLKLKDNRILIQSEGTTIGDIPLPEILPNGDYRKINKGWITTISKQGNVVKSDVKDAFKELFSNDKFADTLNKLWQYTYDKSLSNKDKEKLYKEIYDVLKTNFNSLIRDGEDHKKEVVDFAAELLQYINRIGFDDRVRQTAIRSLNPFFERLYDSYALAEGMYENLSNGKDVYEVFVDKVTEGQINHNGLSDEVDYTNYDKMTYADEAIDEDHKNGTNGRTLEIGFVAPGSRNYIQCKNRTIERGRKSTGLRVGIPYLILSNGTEESHVLGTATRLSDKNAKGLKELAKAIDNEFDYLINEVTKDLNGKSIDSIMQFLWHISGYYGKNWNGNTETNNKYKNQTPLFFGLTWSTTEHIESKTTYVHCSNNLFNIQTMTNNRLFVSKIINVYDEHGNQKFEKDGTPITKKINTIYDLNANPEETKNILKEVIDSFKESLRVNISEQFIRQVPTGSDVGCVGITNSDFTISIPNSETGESKSFIYKDFLDFVMSTGAIKVDTHVGENGSNFEHKGDNQNANQILNVRISQTTTPVEESKVTVTNSTEDTINILNDNTVADKATELLKDDFSEEELKSLKDLDLLPKSIIFDEKYNVETEKEGVIHYEGYNAEANVNTGNVTLGKRWIAMFNETDEFAGANNQYRSQAIRKLIHEQLHLKLNTKDKAKNLKKVEDVYNEFKASLDNVKDAELKAKLEQYLFNAEDKETALEEFLVESFTSKELANYLNNTPSTTKKKSLWDKILSVLKSILNIDVNKGSLLEKNLFIIQDALYKVETKSTRTRTTKKTTSKSTPSTTRKRKTKKEDSRQLTLNFDDSASTSEEKKDESKPKEEPIKKEDDISSLSGLDIFNILTSDNSGHRGINIKHSSITEEVKYPVQNVETFVNSLPLPIQAEFMEKLDSGERKLSCSI